MKRKGSPLFENLLLWLILLVVVNYQTDKFYRPIRLEFLNRLEEGDPIDLLFVGDSTMREGLTKAFKFNWQEDTGQTITTFNGGMGASSTVEHYLLLRKALQEQPQLKAVVYGIIGYRMTDPHFGPQASIPSLIFVEYYQEPDVAAAFQNEVHPLGELKFQIERRIPIYVERYGFWQKVEKLRRQWGAIGLPAKEETRFGRVEDFGTLIHPKRDHFEAHGRAVAAGQTGLRGPCQQFIEDCRERNIPLVVVKMPMSQSHRDKFEENEIWTGYLEALRKLLADEGVTLIDASNWIPLSDKEAFADEIHLNAKGAELFTRRLSRELSKTLGPLESPEAQ